jgi:hypothetical protein
MAKAEWQTTTTLIDEALAILEDEYPMTIRQLFYRLVSAAGDHNNNRSFYCMVSRVMTKARIDRRCPWEWIVDRSRPEYAPNVFTDRHRYAQVVKKAYRKDYWAMQSNYVEIWTEKDAIIGSIEALADELGITVRVTRGFSSATKRHEIEAQVRKIGRTKKIFVLYLGDHDPSGIAIEKNLRETIHADFTIERIAIHAVDIAKFNLPPLRVKEDDRRSKGFVRDHGSDCVELDALPPNELRRRIEVGVRGLMDHAKWERAIKVERAEIESITRSMKLWEKLPPVPPT